MTAAPVTFQLHLNRARERFIRSGIDAAEAALDAELLARHLLGWDRARLLVSGHDETPPGFEPAFEALVERRCRREPMAYILGHREFWTLDFLVSPAVLVPRPETELLVEEALAAAARMPGDALTVVDIGTGSGCVAIAIAHELPDAAVVATDVSDEALDVARENARRHGVQTRIRFVRTAGLPPLPQSETLVVSNPPYVPLAERDRLPPEVRDFEPPAALFGGPDGLDVIRRLIVQVDEGLQRGFFLFEFGIGQESAIRDLIDRRQGLKVVGVAADLQGIPRVMSVTRA